ncbi:MAG: 2-oxo acid dehydrogenase subunit E2 [Clostridiales bacterium]|nr:2-oxo acid dehydrogenase subunit E2 [Clostridiales bacterium]
MGIYNRADGKVVNDLPTYIKFFPFIMRKRMDASIYFSQKIDLTETMKYSEENDIKIFHIFIAALLKLGIEKPAFNRFVVGKRVYQRNELVIGFMAKSKLDEKSDEISVKVYFDEKDDIFDVKRKVQEKVDVVKSGDSFNADKTIDILTKLPKFITSFIFFIIRRMDHFGLLSKNFIDDNPLFVSAYVTNVGSIGIDAPFHHMYEWGTTSLFAALGMIQKDYIIDGKGNAKITDVVNINFTIDERIVDGIYMAKALDGFKKYMENPSLLE